MSYYGIKNLKTIKKENGLYNVSADYYDSSIRDYNGNRVWYHADNLFKEDMEKEELEYRLFQDFLNGNFHTAGNCGKYQCLSWTNCKVKLNKEDYEVLKNLEYCKTHYTDKEERDKAYADFEKTHYELYFKAWKQYLENEKQRKKNTKYIVNIENTNRSMQYVRRIIKGGYLSVTSEIKKAKKFEEKEANYLAELITNKKLYDIAKVYVTTV